MAKTNQIKKVVNGEIADADDVNQIVENAGAEGGSVPYSEVSHERDTTGQESLGSVTYPWGTLNVNEDAYLNEVETTSPSVSASVQIKNLRRFLFLKDCPSSFAGSGGKKVRCNAEEDALEFADSANVEIFTSDGTFTAPSDVSKVFITMIGGGGGGGGSSENSGGGGGAAGELVVMHPYPVTGGNSYIVQVGAGGAGGVGNNNGSVGESSIFDTGGGNYLEAVGGNYGHGTATGVGSYEGGASTAERTAATDLDGDDGTAGGVGGSQGICYRCFCPQGAGGDGNPSSTPGPGGGGGASVFGSGGDGGGNKENGDSAIANTGAGGGGAGRDNEEGGDYSGGAGGSGVVIIMC